MLSSNRWIMMLGLAVVMSGCSSTGDKKGDAEVDEYGTAGAGTGAEASGMAGSGGFSSYSLNDPSSPLSRRIIYFEYDSSEVDAEGQDLVSNHAAFLAANPEQMVTLEGHADERGSREYNIALGEGRAEAVRRMMEFQGVSPGQISIVSYGEEKPSAEEHSEAAWQLNRRVELIYPGY
mgnify:FL=1